MVSVQSCHERQRATCIPSASTGHVMSSCYDLRRQREAEEWIFILCLLQGPFKEKPISDNESSLSCKSPTVSVSRGVISTASNMCGSNHVWVTCCDWTPHPACCSSPSDSPLGPWRNAKPPAQSHLCIISAPLLCSIPPSCRPRPPHRAAIFHHFQTFQTGPGVPL